MNFQENLRTYRERLGISAKDFASQIELPYTKYIAYENKGAEPKYETLCKIAAALHVSIDSLLGYAAPAEHLRLVALVKSCGLEVHEQDNLITVSMSDTLKATLSVGEQKAINNTLSQLEPLSVTDFDGSVQEVEKILMDRNKEQAAVLFVDTLDWWPMING